MQCLPNDQLREMENIEAAMAYVEDSIHSGDSLTEQFIRELHAMPAMTAAQQRTYQIKKLVERNMLQPIKDVARQYTIGFSNSYLMRGVVHALAHEGFITSTLSHGEMQK